MASDSGDRETACTVRVDASCGSLAGQRATTPRGDRYLEKGKEEAGTRSGTWGSGLQSAIVGESLALMLEGGGPELILSDNEEGA